MLLPMKGKDGGGKVKTGSITIDSSGGGRTFNCGIDSPDLVYITEDRQNGDWMLSYLKAGAFDWFTYEDVTYAINSVTSSATAQNYKLSVSGSMVTFPNFSNWYGTTWKWVAIKA